MALYVFIQTPFGQNWIAGQVTKRLSRDLQTKVSIEHIDFALFNQMNLEGVLIEDRDHDTLLYAGKVKVRITDWFFLKKSAELKYIGLEDAVVKFQRTDSVWRQQFFFDYFASPGSGKKKEAGIQFDLKKVELKNVTFVKRDGWLGQDMNFHVGALDLDANAISLGGNVYDINSLFIRDPVVSIRNYQRKKPVDSLAVAASTPQELTDSILHSWNSGRMEVKIANLKIVNGVFASDRFTNRPTYAHFDGAHMMFTEINAEMSNSRFVGDTVYSKLNLTAKERSGLEIKKFSANLKLMPQGMAFNDLDLQTNRSTIRKSFSMSYDDMADMSDFIHKVHMTANFDGTILDSDDIAFFAPNMKSWNKKISLQGKLRGTVDELVGKDLVVRAGNSTVLNGDVSLTGLPDINRTFIDFRANEFSTTYGDAVTIIPALRKITNPDLRKLQYVHFTGSFTGFIRDFVTFGTIRTSLGTVKSDLNMKLPLGRDPFYTGSIATDNFELGKFLGEKSLGSISLAKTQISGSGFDSPQRWAKIVKSSIRYVDFNGYRYRDILIDTAKLTGTTFKGIVSINDENANLDLLGEINFDKKSPKFDLIAHVEKADLRKLNLTKDSIAFEGDFNLNFTGNNIDNFLGTARITNAIVTRDGKDLGFDSLTLSSSYEGTEKVLTLDSEPVDASIRGEFNIADLPNAVLVFLNKYYPSYIDAPSRLPENQSFKFFVKTDFAEEYVKLIDSSLAGFNYVTIEGELNLKNDKITAKAEVPYFEYKQYRFSNVDIQADGSLNDSLSLVINTSNISVNDSLNIPMAKVNIHSLNDVSRVNISTGETRAIARTNLNAIIQTSRNGLNIEFDKSDFVVNGKTWTIDDNGRLQFLKNTPASGELVLREGQQVITIRSASATGNQNNLDVTLQKVNIGDFSPFFMPKNRLEGMVSGTAKITDLTGDMRVIGDIQTEELRLDNDSLGAVIAKIDYSGKEQRLKIVGNTLNQDNFLSFNTNLYLGTDKELQKANIIALNARTFQLNILERFLGTLFSDIRGYITGDFELRGQFSDLDIVGKGQLIDAGLKINFTQVFYEIEDRGIELTPTKIDLSGLVLKDTATGNPVYVDGRIEHNSFREMFYNINVSTRKPLTTDPRFNQPVLLLNTLYRDNQQFYGKVIGTGSFSLTGPQSEMIMAISAIASDKHSSNITIPPSRSRESGLADYMVERQYGREMTGPGSDGDASNIIYDVDVTANKMLDVKVVLDELTGDVIKGKGHGTLNIHSGTNEALRIRGRFDIEEGDYLFTFQSFFKKSFVLRSGQYANNFIEWTGDPYEAKVNLDAIYTATDVNYAPLTNSIGLDNLSNVESDVLVVASLTGQLFKPDINFSLEFPTTSVARTDPGLRFSLQQMEQNKNEMYKQVTYLIVLNSFAPVEGSEGTGTGMDIGDIATNTISGIFLGVINDQLNKIFSKLLKNDKYSINLNTSLYNRNVIDPNNRTALNINSNVNFSIGRSFFNNRFIITAGGGFDAPLQQSNIEQSIQLLPDVTMEWLINPSGTIRASFFYRQNADYLTNSSSGGPGKATRYGGSISLRKEANTFWGLFFKKKKRVDAVPPEEKPEEKKQGDN